MVHQAREGLVGRKLRADIDRLVVNYCRKITACPKDFVENRNISNILEESPSLRNKLMFIGLKARGVLSPRRGRHNNSPGWSRHAAACEGVASEQRETRSPEPRVK